MDDMEAVDYVLQDGKTIRDAGYLSKASFEECRHNAVLGMIKFGNPFTRALGLALENAELNDALKIMRYWNSLSESHALLYKMYLAKYEPKPLE